MARQSESFASGHSPIGFPSTRAVPTTACSRPTDVSKCGMRNELIWDESGELALECLGCTCAPALCDGLGRGIGKDFLFAFLQSVEDALRRRLRRSLWYIEASVHIGINGA